MQFFFNTFVTLLAGKIDQDSFIRLQVRLRLSFAYVLLIYLFHQKLAMPTVSQKPSSNPGLNLTLFSIPQSLLLQVGTASILLLLIAQKATGQALEALGEQSEELFRGDRLPVLNFPEDQQQSQS